MAKKSQIVIDVELDENSVPDKMAWKSTENDESGDWTQPFYRFGIANKKIR